MLPLRATADELLLPAPLLDRAGPHVVVWRPTTPAAGSLTLDWTDAAGRLVERHQRLLPEARPEVALPLDLRRARVPANHLVARFLPQDGAGETEAATSFLAPAAPDWSGFEVLLWHEPPAAALPALSSLGISGTKLFGPASPAGQAAARQRVAAGLRWYTENLATDFYAAYHRWRPGLSPSWLFDEAKAQLRRAPDSLAAFERQPSLSDPAWRRSIAARLTSIAWSQAPFRPLFHNLGDESGIADLAAAWDFDLSPASLAGMRAWLRQGHGSLAALNRAWGRAFESWDAVMPSLTRDALRDDAALPSWMEFKAWMDHVFADAVREGAAALRHGDPAALAALEGGQIPGWGGYDYGRLAPVLDVMEIYDNGNAIEIAQSLNPALRVLTTSFADDAAERRRLWRALLLGARGSVIWDEAGGVLDAEGRPGPRGLAMAPTWQAMRGPLGRQLLAARPLRGEVAILYSQPSFRLSWLFERRAAGDDWTARDAEAESGGGAWHAATRRAVALLAGLGIKPVWITPEALAAGGLEAGDTRLLLLPHSLALSSAEVAALRRFAAAGGTLLADVPPGERDEAGRPREALPLQDLSPDRLRILASLQADGAGPEEVTALLAEVGLHPPLRFIDPDGAPARRVELRVFQDGGLLLAGLLPAEDAAGEREVELRLDAPLHLRSLRDGRAAIRTDRARFRLGPDAPLLLALSPVPFPRLRLMGPARAAPGETVELRLAWDAPPAATAQMIHLEVADPSGRPVPALSETLAVPREGLSWQMPFALNDAPGRWTVRVTELIGGTDVGLEVELR